jgi:ERCC4-type nuclease
MQERREEVVILIDNRVGSKELLPFVQRVGYTAQLDHLEFGDACFEGNGPRGRMGIGIERKTLSDMLNCIDDSRYAAHQRPGLLAMYDRSILIIEGIWKPDAVSGYLMECIRTLEWRPLRYRMQMTRYAKLFRYLLTVQLAGQIVIQTRDMEHTAYNICECFSYFQKKWDDHTSLLETQKLNMPALAGPPSLVRRWAADLDGVGVKYSMEAERLFRTPFELAQSNEADWLTIPGIGVRTAQSIVRQIHETPNGR